MGERYRLPLVLCIRSHGGKFRQPGVRGLPGSSTVSSQDSHMPLRKVWKEKPSSPVSQL